MKISELKTADELFADLPPARCEKCKRILVADLPNSRLCRSGYCTRFFCPCGHEFASFGPVGCPTCSPWSSPQMHRARREYQRRHRRGKRWT